MGAARNSGGSFYVVPSVLSALDGSPNPAMSPAWFFSLMSDALGVLLAGEDARSPETLMARYQSGDSAAFHTLYRNLGPRIFGYLLRMTRDRAAAEDLVQITFTKVHRARDSFLPGEKVLPWIFAIARRSFLDERRRIAARREDLSRDGHLPEGRTSPDSHDAAERLEAALTRIPENYAEAIELTKLAGLSVREAASVLGTTEAAVKLRVHRGYAVLREALTALEAEHS